MKRRKWTREKKKGKVENLSAVCPFVCGMAMFAEHVLSFGPFRIADLRCKRMLEPHQLVTTTTFTSHPHPCTPTHSHSCHIGTESEREAQIKAQEVGDCEKYNHERKKTKTKKTF